jgi:hypothetical protein
MSSTFDREWNEPLTHRENGHELLPLPMLDVIESEICGAENTHGAPCMLLDCWPEYGEM